MIDFEITSNMNGLEIAIESACHLRIERGLFLDHASNLSVIQTSAGGQVTIKDSLFNGSNLGGAIVARDSALEIQHCNFTELNAVNGSSIFFASE